MKTKKINQDEFLKNWSEGDSYALVQGKNFQILLPTDDREYVKNSSWLLFS